MLKRIMSFEVDEKVAVTVSVCDKPMWRKNHVVTEDKLGDIRARLKTNPKESLSDK